MNYKQKPDLKILLIQFRPAGDVLLLTPAVKAIKAQFPHSKVDFIVNEKESVLIWNFPLIDKIITIKKHSKKSLSCYLRYLLYTISLYRYIRNRRYDVVIDFIGNPKSAAITFFSRANKKIGRKVSFRSIVYNFRITHHHKNMNTVERRLNYLKPLGINSEYTQPVLFLSNHDIKTANNFVNSLNIPKKRRIIFLAPNSPRGARRWKAEYFISIAEKLTEVYNAKILLAWGPGEEDFTKKIKAAISSDAEMIPPCSLTEMAAIISLSDLIITNDCGTKHLANAVGVRSITIYGPTNPFVWNHIDMDNNPAIRADVACIQCEKRECPLDEHICMQAITPEIVMKVAQKLLDEGDILYCE
ncbi:MAG: glycosyltransferase family 9 protein [Spirochaetota bacterium]|nr:glycosyltransferase family 9 protein [Spirochaetota bacterium]